MIFKDIDGYRYRLSRIQHLITIQTNHACILLLQAEQAYVEAIIDFLTKHADVTPVID